MKKTSNKRNLILDAMQGILTDASTNSVTVSDIAKRAGIGKGSIYYYFKSKEDILDAVIERFFLDTIERCRTSVESANKDVFEKLGIVFRTCRETSLTLGTPEATDFLEAQNSAWMHQKYVCLMVKQVSPILADIIRQGMREGTIVCGNPVAISELVALVLVIKLDNWILPSSNEEISSFLLAFRDLLQSGLSMPSGTLAFLSL